MFSGIKDDVVNRTYVKLVFRHSLRPPLYNVNNPDNVLLSEEGLLRAREFGNQISLPIGEIHSSHIERCVQTSKCIIESKKLNSEVILSRDVLGDVFSVDRDIANASIRHFSLKGVIKKMIDEESVPGLRKMEDCVRDLLDYFFGTGNTIGTVDLYCTHDFHIAMLYAVLFRESATMDEIISNWPDMLEGMVFCGTRNDFWCFWRGRSKHVVNQK